MVCLLVSMYQCTHLYITSNNHSGIGFTYVDICLTGITPDGSFLLSSLRDSAISCPCVYVFCTYCSICILTVSYVAINLFAPVVCGRNFISAGFVLVGEERLRKIEQEGYDVLYTAEVQNYMDRKNTLETNLGRAYALILSTYCNGMMQHHIEEHPEFDSKIQNDPIELLKAIKIVMHNPIRAKYPYASLTEALMRTLNIKQLEQESHINYMKRFKQSRDVLKSHISGDILNKFVENLPEYRHSTMSGQQEIKSEAFGRWMAYMMIRNSDQAKYCSLLNGMVSQFLMNNNQYPVDIRQATDILSNHKHDSHKTRRDRARLKDDKDESTKTNEASFTQSENTKMCYCCGKTRHMSPKCSEKDKIPREDWAIRKAALHMQAEKTKDDEEASQSDKSPKKTRWSGMQVCLMDKKKDISAR